MKRNFLCAMQTHDEYGRCKLNKEGEETLLCKLQ